MLTLQNLKSKNKFHSAFVSDIKIYNAEDSRINSKISNMAKRETNGTIDLRLIQWLNSVKPDAGNPVALINAVHSSACFGCFGDYQQRLGGFQARQDDFKILAGDIMGQDGISDRLITLANALVGRFRGGLAS